MGFITLYKPVDPILLRKNALPHRRGRRHRMCRVVYYRRRQPDLSVPCIPVRFPFLLTKQTDISGRLAQYYDGMSEYIAKQQCTTAAPCRCSLTPTETTGSACPTWTQRTASKNRRPKFPEIDARVPRHPARGHWPGGGGGGVCVALRRGKDGEARRSWSCRKHFPLLHAALEDIPKGSTVTVSWTLDPLGFGHVAKHLLTLLSSSLSTHGKTTSSSSSSTTRWPTTPSTHRWPRRPRSA